SAAGSLLLAGSFPIIVTLGSTRPKSGRLASRHSTARCSTQAGSRKTRCRRGTGPVKGPSTNPPPHINFRPPAAKVASPAVAAISTDATGLNGYIYVIGGNVPVGDATDAIYSFSSYAVRIGTVANGHITGWLDQTLAHFPFPVLPGDAISYGVQQA